MSISFSAEQDQYLQLAQTRAYYRGLREGIEKYAYWKDGVQYVGTTGRPLKKALDKIAQEEQDILSRYQCTPT